jgi:glucose-1-phosphate adenylyltransferase
VAFGGAYRIIDFTLSNCINSDIRRIFVLTQYKSLELIRHVRDGWSILSPELGEFIELIPAMKQTGEGIFTASA